MSEGTPNDDDMQEQFVAGAMVTGFAYSRDEARQDWTKWLAAHDAELLARVQPSREEVARALCDYDDAAAGWASRWEDTQPPMGQVRDSYLEAADVFLALLPGRGEAEVRADERERVAREIEDVEHVLPIHVGGGNLVDRRRVIHAEDAARVIARGGAS